jgi:hypothetical protein
MCPMCIGTALTIAAMVTGAASAGGATALVVHRLRPRPAGGSPKPETSNGESHGSPERRLVR